MQEWQPIAFTRKALNTTKKCYAEIEKKLLLIVHAACDSISKFMTEISKLKLIKKH